MLYPTLSSLLMFISLQSVCILIQWFSCALSSHRILISTFLVIGYQFFSFPHCSILSLNKYTCTQGLVFILDHERKKERERNSLMMLLINTIQFLHYGSFMIFSADALEQNQELEFERNRERFVFLKVLQITDISNWLFFCIYSETCIYRIYWGHLHTISCNQYSLCPVVCVHVCVHVYSALTGVTLLEQYCWKQD